MELFSSNLNELDMTAFAVRLAPLLQRGDCLAFFGDLGAGKTTFIRAIIKKLAKVDEVPSPTFTLVQSYDSQGLMLLHYDLYRLKNPVELYELGFEDSLHDGLTFIEWPERANGLLPAHHLALHFTHLPDNQGRKLIIKGDNTWAARLAPLKT